MSCYSDDSLSFAFKPLTRSENLRAASGASPGAVDHLLAERLQVLLSPTGRAGRPLGGENGLLRGGARMFAGTQTTSSPVRLETFLPLLPQTLDTPAVSERKDSGL